MYTMPLFSQESESDNLKEIRQKQIANIHSPELWDMDRMKNDIEPMNEGLPIRYGAFPVPHYKSLGSYKGGGFVSNNMARSIPELGDESFRLLHNGRTPDERAPILVAGHLYAIDGRDDIGGQRPAQCIDQTAVLAAGQAAGLVQQGSDGLIYTEHVCAVLRVGSTQRLAWSSAVSSLILKNGGG